MNETCHIAFTKGSKMTREQADRLHSRLRNWYDGMPGQLQPKTIVLPGQLQMQ